MQSHHGDGIPHRKQPGPRAALKDCRVLVDNHR
jgi:hypothetical protein